MDGKIDLERFVAAQQPVWSSVMAELTAGRKRTHWMWFVFPQLRGLGSSAMAVCYGIGSIDEARAYLGHPVLGARLVASTAAVLTHVDRPLLSILGTPDDMKFRSSMTLFAEVGSEDAGLFQQALDVFCGGQADERTVALLKAQSGRAHRPA